MSDELGPLTFAERQAGGLPRPRLRLERARTREDTLAADRRRDPPHRDRSSTSAPRDPDRAPQGARADRRGAARVRDARRRRHRHCSSAAARSSARCSAAAKKRQDVAAGKVEEDERKQAPAVDPRRRRSSARARRRRRRRAGLRPSADDRSARPDRPAGPRLVVVMGVVNVTPDSFSDGGAFLDPAAAIAHGRRAGRAGRRHPRRRRRGHQPAGDRRSTADDGARAGAAGDRGPRRAPAPGSRSTPPRPRSPRRRSRPVRRSSTTSRAGCSTPR